MELGKARVNPTWLELNWRYGVNLCVCMCVRACVFPSMYTKKAKKQGHTRLEISTSKAKILVSECHSPLKRNRAPWENGWFHVRGREDRVSLENSVCQKVRQCSKANGVIFVADCLLWTSP